MVQKEDYNKLDDASKERLDKVLKTIEAKKIRFPNRELSEKMEWDSGVVSSYLNAKKPISDNFYTKFVQVFMNSTTESDTKGEPEEKLSSKLFMETILELSQNVTRLSLTNEKLVDSNAELITMAAAARPRISFDDVLESQPSVSELLLPLVEKVAASGVEAGIWPSIGAARAILDKWLFDGIMGKQVLDK